MPDHAFISIGSNIEPEKFLPLALEQLHGIGRVIGVSNVYQSAATGMAASPDFLNAAVLLDTTCSADEVRDRLRDIETSLGRVRGNDKYVARRIDLDLCFLDQQILSKPEWALPHHDVTERAYVAIPLAELAPEFVHPVTRETLREVARRLGGKTALTPRSDVVLRMESE